MTNENPYELLDLDPSQSVEELTAELRKRVERANPDEQLRLQKAWRQLTLKDEERVRLGLLTHPRADAGRDPIRKIRDAVPPFISRRKPTELVATVRDAIAAEPRTVTSPQPPNPWGEEESS